MIAISAGLLATVVVGKLDVMIVNGAAPLLGFDGTFQHPASIPEVSFTWWAMIGALVVFGVGVLFRTPEPVLVSAARHADDARAAATTCPSPFATPRSSTSRPLARRRPTWTFVVDIDLCLQDRRGPAINLRRYRFRWRILIEKTRALTFETQAGCEEVGKR